MLLILNGHIYILKEKEEVNENLWCRNRACHDFLLVEDKVIQGLENNHPTSESQILKLKLKNNVKKDQ
jgi:hypothetical protein